MCRAWPGFHCSNHPSDKVRALARQLHNLEKKKEETALEQKTFRDENPDTWEGSDQDGFYTDEVVNLQKQIDETESKRDAEMTEFFATPKGKKVLEEKIADETKSEEQRFDSAAELAAANDRRLRQKKIALLLHRPDVPMNIKIWRAQVEMRRSRQELAKFNEREETVKAQLNSINSMIEMAKEDGDREEEKRLTEERNRYVRELALIEKYKTQLESHMESTSSWLKRFHAHAFDKAFDFSESLINLTFKYLI